VKLEVGVLIIVFKKAFGVNVMMTADFKKSKKGTCFNGLQIMATDKVPSARERHRKD